MRWLKRMSDPEPELRIEPVEKIKKVEAFKSDAGKLYDTKEDYIYDVIVGRFNRRHPDDPMFEYYPHRRFVYSEDVKRIVELWEELRKEIE